MTESNEQPPAAVQYAINLHAVRMQRKAKIEANVGDINTKLAGLKAQADELLKMREELWSEYAAVELDANVALEMAHAACRAHGWAVPEAQDEPPLTQTGQFPAVQPPEPVVCKHCGRAVARLPHADWHHKDSGFIACYPDGVVSTEAEPVQPGEATQVIPAVPGQLPKQYQPVPDSWPQRYPHAVAWDKGRDLVICAEDRDGLVCGQPVESGPCALHTPADLDTPTTTPAQDGGQG